VVAEVLMHSLLDIQQLLFHPDIQDKFHLKGQEILRVVMVEEDQELIGE
jgi:hypothetical protein